MKQIDINEDINMILFAQGITSMQDKCGYKMIMSSYIN